jgi:hypothetical protein
MPPLNHSSRPTAGIGISEKQSFEVMKAVVRLDRLRQTRIGP